MANWPVDNGGDRRVAQRPLRLSHGTGSASFNHSIYTLAPEQGSVFYAQVMNYLPEDAYQIHPTYST